MPDIPRGWRLVAAVFAVCLLAGMVGPGTASAQELRPSLKVPTVIASVAAAADWASTYHAMTNYHVRETNFLLQGLQGSPGKLVTAGAAIDVATFAAWNTMIGPRHPKVAVCRHVGHGRLSDVPRRPQPPQRTAGASPHSLTL